MPIRQRSSKTPSLTDSFSAIAAREDGLRRTLTSAQLSMIAIGGAIGTGLFLGSGFAISLAGPSVLVSYFIGAIITLLLMGCLAEMTVAHPTSGSFGDWAEHYLHPLVGFLVRYAYWAGVVFALGTEVSAIAIYMRFWFPAVPGLVWITFFAGLLILVNALSVKAFGSIEYVFSALKLFAIAAFLLLGTWLAITAPRGYGVGIDNLYNSGMGGFAPHGFFGTWAGVLVALFSYFSIEMIAIAAGEAADPKRAITSAFKSTMFRLAFFYLLTIFLILTLSDWRKTAAGGESPFVSVMRATHIPYAPAVVNAIILIAALSAMNSQLYITSRMLFTLARAGQAPSLFGQLTARGVPVPALLASTAGIAIAAVLNALSPNRAFLLLFAISCFGPMFAWLVIFLTHLAFRRRHVHTAGDFRAPGYPLDHSPGRHAHDRRPSQHAVHPSLSPHPALRPALPGHPHHNLVPRRKTAKPSKTARSAARPALGRFYFVPASHNEEHGAPRRQHPQRQHPRRPGTTRQISRQQRREPPDRRRHAAHRRGLSRRRRSRRRLYAKGRRAERSRRR